MLQRVKFGVIALVLIVAVIALVPLFFRDVGDNKFAFWKKSNNAVASEAPAIAGSGSPAALGTLGSFGSTSVTRDELNSTERLKLYEAESQVYNAIEEIVVQRYVTNYFADYQKEKNLPDTFAAQNEFFKDKVAVNDAEVKKLLDENKDNPNLQRIPEPERIMQVRQYLEGNARRVAMKEFVDSAKARGDIQIGVPRPVEPRLEISDGGNKPVYGPEDAKVTIVEFADYQCPFCARMVPTLKEVTEKYEGKVRWVYRDFPLREIHPEALPAAVAANCAGEQGKYKEMHHALFENYQNLNSALYTKLAGDLKLDGEKFATCLKDPKQSEEVMRDYADGTQYGVQGTPSYYINGRKLGNGGDVREFSRLIDEELARM